MSLRKTKYLPDFTDLEFKSVLDKYLNGAHYPLYDIEFSQISKTSTKYTGENGELVSVTPFFLRHVSPSFVPSSSECLMSQERYELNCSKENFYIFSVDSTILPDAQRALCKLTEKVSGGYVVPLFHKTREITLLKKARVVSPWRFEEQSVYFNKLKEENEVLEKIPLLKECAVILPHSEIEEPEGKAVYSYNSGGEVCFHGVPERITGDNYSKLGSFLTSILSRTDREYTINEYAEEIIELLPTLFDMKWTSKKMKHITENIIFESIEEKSVPANMSFNNLLSSLKPVEILHLSEKILYKYFGIGQYFKIRYKK